MNLVVHPFFDTATASWSYVLANPGSGCCAVVDPVLDYDPASGSIGTTGADSLLELIRANGYCAEWILETHVHADHLSAAQYLKRRLVCAQLATGAGVRTVQARLAPELGLDMATDGRQFDRLLEDGERICLGHACGRVMFTPGHTPACVSYVFDRFVFVGDTVFMPDYGTARCDFPGGDARRLYRSVQKLYALPGETRMLMCHDYPSGRRGASFHATVTEQRSSNVMLRSNTPLDAFVAEREKRDRSLEPPTLFRWALRANLAGGMAPGDELCAAAAAEPAELASAERSSASRLRFHAGDRGRGTMPAGPGSAP